MGLDVLTLTLVCVCHLCIFVEKLAAVKEAEKNNERFVTLKNNLEAMLKRIASLTEEVEGAIGVTKEKYSRPPGQAVTLEMLADFTKFEKSET